MENIKRIQESALPLLPGYGTPETREAIAAADAQFMAAINIDAISMIDRSAFESPGAASRAAAYISCRRGVLNVIEYREENSKQGNLQT